MVFIFNGFKFQEAKQMSCENGTKWSNQDWRKVYIHIDIGSIIWKGPKASAHEGRLRAEGRLEPSAVCPRLGIQCRLRHRRPSRSSVLEGWQVKGDGLRSHKQLLQNNLAVNLQTYRIFWKLWGQAPKWEEEAKKKKKKKKKAGPELC
jgi:hypothetical protein